MANVGRKPHPGECSELAFGAQRTAEQPFMTQVSRLGPPSPQVRSRISRPVSVARRGAILGTLSLALPILLGQGCPGFGGGSSGGGVAVKSPSIDINVNAGEVVTIVYDA